jgi:DNA mismatch endonuclease (patch repair protein)
MEVSMKAHADQNGLERAAQKSKTAPSFKGLAAASTFSSEVKRRNRSKDTAHELALRKLLWRAGLRYRKNVKELPGKPDIVFTRKKIAIFCDGDFWHGRDWESLSHKLVSGNNPSYWLQKVHSNRERDSRNNGTLSQLGWLVLRFWETDIKRFPRAIVDEILAAIGERS